MDYSHKSKMPVNTMPRNYNFIIYETHKLGHNNLC